MECPGGVYCVYNLLHTHALTNPIYTEQFHNCLPKLFVVCSYVLKTLIRDMSFFCGKDALGKIY